MDLPIGWDTVPGPDGTEIPYVYGLDGTPTDPQTGAALLKDVARRTLGDTEVPGARRVITLFLVFDDDAATGTPDPQGPRLWGTAVTEDGFPREVRRYRSADAARAGHTEVVSELRAEPLPFPHGQR